MLTVSTGVYIYIANNIVCTQTNCSYSYSSLIYLLIHHCRRAKSQLITQMRCTKIDSQSNALFSQTYCRYKDLLPVDVSEGDIVQLVPVYGGLAAVSGWFYCVGQLSS